MRVLLTGARGFLGSRIRQTMEVIPAPSLRDMGREEIARLVGETAPDVIVHTAAISDIGACQANPEGSYRANVELPVWLAETAKNAKLVMLSTDQVYSAHSEPGPYREEDTAPGNLYAEHKLEMERRVLEISPDAVLLRATWMYDLPLYGAANRGNFLMNLLRAAATGEPMLVPMEQYRGLTYVREAAENMAKAMRLPGGVYNFGSETELTMGQITRQLRERLGLNLQILQGQPRHNLWMDCRKAAEGGCVFSSTAEGLENCLSDYGLI